MWCKKILIKYKTKFIYILLSNAFTIIKFSKMSEGSFVQPKTFCFTQTLRPCLNSRESSVPLRVLGNILCFQSCQLFIYFIHNVYISFSLQFFPLKMGQAYPKAWINSNFISSEMVFITLIKLRLQEKRSVQDINLLHVTLVKLREAYITIF